MPERIDDPFLFDQADFWNSEAVEMMTGEQVAAYVRLLSVVWAQGDLPSSAQGIAAKLNSGSRLYTAQDVVGSGSLDEPSEGSIWAAVGICFDVNGDGRLCNARMWKERKAWLKKKANWSKGGRIAGKASGKARRKSKKTQKIEPKTAAERFVDDSLTKAERNLNEKRTESNSSSSSSSSSRDEDTSSSIPPARKGRRPDSERWAEEIAELWRYRQEYALPLFNAALGRKTSRGSLKVPKVARGVLTECLRSHDPGKIRQAMEQAWHDAWLMGFSGRRSGHQTSIEAWLRIRSTGEKTIDLCGKLAEKTEPDPEIDGSIRLRARHWIQANEERRRLLVSSNGAPGDSADEEEPIPDPDWSAVAAEAEYREQGAAL